MKSNKSNCKSSDGRLKQMSSANDIKNVAGKGKCKMKGKR